MPYAVCLQCDEDIYLLETPNIGEIVRCPTCDARLEVVGIHPIELDWPWEFDEEDVDDEDDDFAEGYEIWDEDEDEEDDQDDTYDFSAYNAFDDEDDFSYARIKHDD